MSNEDLHDLYLNTLHELNHEKLRREAFEKDVEMHKKMTRLLADRAAETIVERDRLKAEVERLDTLCKQLGKQHSDISCENIRLRKAGDWMLLALWLGVDEYSKEQKEKAEQAWNAAKEGKQPEEVLWVQLEDYEKLKAEVERLISTIGAQAVELDDLRARLRK